MRAYHQSDLFALLTSAAANNECRPDATALSVYKEKRLARAVKALRSRNVLLYTEGQRTSLNVNNLTTVYTQPVGSRLIVVGYANNTRYGTTQQWEGGIHFERFLQMHALRVEGPNGARPIVESLIPSQAGIVGEPRYTSTVLPAPFILEANEQLAVDLGWDTAADPALGTEAEVVPEAYVFFCVRVRDRLTPEDYFLINELKRFINIHDFQRAIYLNCVSQGVETISFSSAVTGGIAQAETRPANQPLLITGIATSLAASRIMITDIGDGHSFTLNRSAQSSALMMPAQDNGLLAVGQPGAPAAAPIWTEYTEFPIPHLLIPGASLRVDLLNGGPSQVNGLNSQVDAQFGNVLLFQGVNA